MKTIIFLCGLIGSGKTTYALKNFKNFTDLDKMPKYSSKKDQIVWTKKLLEKHERVCHITCYPTEEEIHNLKDFNLKFILLDTDIKQAKTNILIRNRKRDMDNINNVLKANEDYFKKYKNFKYPWEKVSVFK